jgi:putative copper export protein
MTGALWLHVAAASWWVLTCVTMAMAGAVMNADSAEAREFASRVAPRFNRANVVAAGLLLLTGVINLFGAGTRRRFDFSIMFTRILAVKLGLYAMMVAALMASLVVQRKWREGNQGGVVVIGAGGLAALWALIALCGAAAMMLGVWLAGE